MIDRVILIVLDSVGVGALPDAAAFGDEGADTLGNIARTMGERLSLPSLARLGLYRLLPETGLTYDGPVEGCYGRMASASPAKDTTAGHWELTGVVLDRPFPVYPHGFPPSVIEEFERRTDTKVLGNCTASGTEIIKRLGAEHCRTGNPIVYTSADSVFQIAAHESVIDKDRLYGMCRTARGILTGEHAVGRVIARPFTGKAGAFRRTGNRRDFSLSPPGPTVLNRMRDAGGEVRAIGKIEDIFNGQGITRATHTHCNSCGMEVTLGNAVNTPRPGVRSLVFTNLVDFDMLWGHRRDVRAYANGLMEFDEFLPKLLDALRNEDILIITADHGCDPTCTRHTDHTREYVPLLVYGKRVRNGVDLGVRSTFADVGQTVADIFDLEPLPHGTSFRSALGL